MNHKCPHCGTLLQQLGRTETRSERKVWVGENLYRCHECKAPDNRFMVIGGAVMSPEAEGWLAMTSPEVPAQREVTV